MPVAKVVSMEAVKLYRKSLSNLIGKARCLSCDYEWESESPPGFDWLECPSCSLVKGRFIYPVKRKEPHWTCDCGCDYFAINTEGVYCPHCGTWQDGFLETIERV